MQTSFGQFTETQSQDAFALQNSKLLEVRLEEVAIQAKLGAMVAYQSEVTFEHAGSGGLGRMLKKAVSGEVTQLIKVSGSGELFLADQAQDVHLLYLENDLITQDRLRDEEPGRPRLRRDAADGLHRPGLAARPAVRGSREREAGG
jgi:biogenesis AIM24-like protein